MAHADPTVRPKVGLVLGSEGIKAFSALPLLEFIMRESIPIDLTVAVSGGALLASLWGAGFNISQITSLFTKAVDRKFYTEVDYRSILDIANIAMGRFHLDSGILKPAGLQRAYEKIFRNLRIEELCPETKLLATDLLSGQGVVLSQGLLSKAVYASGALYPLMPAAMFGDRHLIDGSFRSPLPVMECVKRGMDVIIAMYFDDACNPEPEGFLQCYFNANKVLRRSVLRSDLPLAIDMHTYEIIPIYIRHPKSLEIWEVERLSEILFAGKTAVQNASGQILAALKGFRAEFSARENRLCGTDETF